MSQSHLSFVSVAFLRAHMMYLTAALLLGLVCHTTGGERRI